MFGLQWSSGERMHAGSQSEKASTGGRPKSGSSQKKNKRQIHERESSPPDDENSGRGEKRRRAEPQAKEAGLLFACPFNKHDPEKYCPNTDTGTKFRSCIGPGFPSIARLKQHLKRTHSAPIQCQRCWITLPDLQTMARHANEETRCERTDPQPEGIDQDRMRLITSSWGATWSKIYEILFPGAPVPSPYYETPSLPQERSDAFPTTPASQGIADFEAYNRRALPLLVEANLQAIVDAEMAPLEGSLRTMLVDIVRRCQSTIAQNFQRMQESESHSSNSELAPAPDAISKEPPAAAPPQPTKPTRSALHYQEPPFQPEAGQLDWGLPCANHSQNRNLQDLISDSGYGSGVNVDLCDCPCQQFNVVDLPVGLQNCENCATKHSEDMRPFVSVLVD